MGYLDFQAHEQSRSLYRITKVDRFVQGLESGENVMVRPEKWEDPLDGALLHAYGRLPDGGSVAFRLRQNYFGQCWSRIRETDLMWRAYSPDRDGVKLRVKAVSLHDSLERHLGNIQGPVTGHAFLGKVAYQKKEEFWKTLRRGCQFGAPSESQARALLVKRYGFRSEREARLIAYAEYESEPSLIRYPVDWNGLVLEAVLDPRMPKAAARKAKERIQRAGYRGRVVQSGLYRDPGPISFSVDLDGTPRGDP